MRKLWRSAADSSAAIAHSNKIQDVTYRALDLAIRREPGVRTSEDLTLLAAWATGLQMNGSVSRSLNIPVMCKTMRLMKPRAPAGETLALQGDESDAMFIVYSGHLSTYSFTDEEGAPPPADVERAMLMRKLKKRLDTDAAVRARLASKADEKRPRPEKWSNVLAEAGREDPKVMEMTRYKPPDASFKRKKRENAVGAPALSHAAPPSPRAPPPPPPRPPSKAKFSEDASIRESAAVRMQAQHRGQVQRKQLDAMNKAATRLSACERGRRQRADNRKRHKAAVSMQSAMRGRKVRRDVQKQHSAAMALQAVQRGRRARQQTRQQREAAAAAAAAAEESDSPRVGGARSAAGGAGSGATERRRVLCQYGRVMHPLGCFGERSLISASASARHEVCIVTDEPTELICVDAASYRAMHANAIRESIQRRVDLLSSLPAFSAHSPGDLSEFAAALRQASFSKGEAIPPAPDAVLLVESGQATLTVRDEHRKWAPPRQLLVLGAGSLYSSAGKASAGLREAVSATTDGLVLRGSPCSILWLDRKTLQSTLGMTTLGLVTSQAEAAVELIRAGAQRAAVAVAQHTPAAYAAGAAAEAKPAWRKPPALRKADPRERGAQPSLTPAQKKKFAAHEPFHQPEVRAGQVVTHRQPPPPPPPPKAAPTRAAAATASAPGSSATVVAAPTAVRAAPAAARASGSCGALTPSAAPASANVRRTASSHSAGGPAAAAAPPAMMVRSASAAFLLPTRPSLPLHSALAQSTSAASLERGWRAGGYGGLRPGAYVVDQGREGTYSPGRVGNPAPAAARPTPGGIVMQMRGIRAAAAASAAAASDESRRSRPWSAGACTTSGEWARAAAEGERQGGVLIAEGGALLSEASARVKSSGQGGDAGEMGAGPRHRPPPQMEGTVSHSDRAGGIPPRPSSAPPTKQGASRGGVLSRPSSAPQRPPMDGGGSGGAEGAGARLGASASAAACLAGGGAAAHSSTRGSKLMPHSASAAVLPGSTGSALLGQGYTSLRLDSQGFAPPPQQPRKPSQYSLNLGQDLLEPLNAAEVDRSTIRVARPRSAEADEKMRQYIKTRPPSALIRDLRGSAEWVRRENRVANNLRKHVIEVRAATAPPDSKSALLAKRQAYAAAIKPG